MVKRCQNQKALEFQLKIFEMCDPETLRYYLTAKLNDKVEDLDLNFEGVQRINSDLVGKYLNIASRSATFLKKIMSYLRI